MTPRVGLAILSGLLTGILGLRCARGMRAEAARLCRWTALLERLRLILSQSALPLPDALAEAADAQDEPDKLMHDLAEGLRRNPLSSLRDCYEEAAQPAAEAPLLLALMTQLDRGTLESRLLAIDHALRGIEQLAKAAAERADKDAAMWARLGWTAGACLTILLI